MVEDSKTGHVEGYYDCDEPAPIIVRVAKHRCGATWPCVDASVRSLTAWAARLPADPLAGLQGGRRAIRHSAAACGGEARHRSESLFCQRGGRCEREWRAGAGEGHPRALLLLAGSLRLEALMSQAPRAAVMARRHVPKAVADPAPHAHDLALYFCMAAPNTPPPALAAGATPDGHRLAGKRHYVSDESRDC